MMMLTLLFEQTIPSDTQVQRWIEEFKKWKGWPKTYQFNDNNIPFIVQWSIKADKISTYVVNSTQIYTV